jgi:hypothetical protein
MKFLWPFSSRSQVAVFRSQILSVLSALLEMRRLPETYGGGVLENRPPGSAHTDRDLIEMRTFKHVTPSVCPTKDEIC